MVWHPFTLTVQTPMFLGGAEERPPRREESFQAPFRVASLRGELRYWLRALVGRFLAGEEVDVLSHVESMVFGAATKKENAEAVGPSRVLLRSSELLKYRQPSKDTLPLDLHSRYVFGQGLYLEKPKDRFRRFVEEGAEIGLRVKIKTDDPDIEAACTDLFLSALWALCTFGGLGSRARHGFGTARVSDFDSLPCSSFQLRWFDTQYHFSPVMRKVVYDSLQRLGIKIPVEVLRRGMRGGASPRYPSLVFDSKLGDREIPVRGDGSPWTALSCLGEWWRNFRIHEKISSPPEEFTCTAEYDNIISGFLDNPESADVTSTTFVVGALGLPTVYSDYKGKNEAQRQATVEPRTGGGKRADVIRRASPLWLRVYNEDGQWRLRSLWMPAAWLPDDAHLYVRDTTTDRRLADPDPGDIEELVRQWFTAAHHERRD